MIKHNQGQVMRPHRGSPGMQEVRHPNVYLKTNPGRREMRGRDPSVEEEEVPIKRLKIFGKLFQVDLPKIYKRIRDFIQGKSGIIKTPELRNNFVVDRLDGMSNDDLVNKYNISKKNLNKIINDLWIDP